jgi:transposase
MRRNRNWLLERAKAILAKEALTVGEIMERFGVPRATAWDWARRYRAEKPTDMRRV